MKKIFRKTVGRKLMINSAGVLSSILLLQPITTSTALASQITSSTFNKYIDSIFKSYEKNHGYSGTVLVEKDGHILYEGAYGYADFSTKTKNTLQTRYAIGALTEGFTAVAIMQLKEKGLLALTDDIRKYIPEYPAAGDTVTIGELLTHTSGAPASKLQQPIKPGALFEFSMANYAVLGKIIEKVSGESYASYIQSHILNPLGMNNTGLIDDMSKVQNSAVGYVPANGGFQAVDLQATKYASSSGIYSTVGDMYKWEQALETHKLINNQDEKLMFTPTQQSIASLKKFGFGAGWQVSLDGASALVDSRFGGFHSFMGMHLTDGSAIIMLTNQDNSPIAQCESQINPLLLEVQPNGSTTKTNKVTLNKIRAVLSSSQMKVKSTSNVKVTAFFSDGTSQDVSVKSKVTSAHGLVKVSGHTLTGIKRGTDSITVSYEGKTVHVSVKVK